MATSTIILTIALYVALLFVVAWRSSRHSDNATFFTGRRSTPRLVAMVAMVGAAMSGVTYISVPGTVATDGFSYLQTCLGFFVGYAIIAFVLIPLYYRLGVVSLYEYLDHRFGVTAHRTGAWLFFVAKIASASLRAYVVCVVLQSLLYDVWGVPFWVNAAIMMTLVWLYTRRGGVRSVVWVEMLKTIIMVASIVLCILFVIRALGLDFGGAITLVADGDYSRIFFFDDPLDGRYFWKQFIAGIFLVVAMTGLDQDMMQTMLSCRTERDAKRGMMSSIVVQIVVIALFLSLGVLLYAYAAKHSLTDAGDNLFGAVATHSDMPAIVGVMFLLGLIASTYSSAGSALTALTTSFTLDILKGDRNDEHKRKLSHALIAVAITAIILLFERFSSAGAITLIFTMASYTYGPLLGLFAFGILSRRMPRKWNIVAAALLSPLFCYMLSTHSEAWFAGYRFSYELLIINAAITLLILYAFSRKK